MVAVVVSWRDSERVCYETKYEEVFLIKRVRLYGKNCLQLVLKGGETATYDLSEIISFSF